VQMPLLRAVLDVNAGQADEMVALVKRHVADLSGVPVTVLGLAFKPDTDDVRESPAFRIIRLLKRAGAKVTAYDPIARPTSHEDMKDVRLADSLDDAVKGAKVVALVTRWREFERLSQVLDRLGSKPLVVDGRRVLKRDQFSAYEGIGWRPTQSTASQS